MTVKAETVGGLAGTIEGVLASGEHSGRLVQECK